MPASPGNPNPDTARRAECSRSSRGLVGRTACDSAQACLRGNAVQLPARTPSRQQQNRRLRRVVGQVERRSAVIVGRRVGLLLLTNSRGNKTSRLAMSLGPKFLIGNQTSVPVASDLQQRRRDSPDRSDSRTHVGTSPQFAAMPTVCPVPEGHRDLHLLSCTRSRRPAAPADARLALSAIVPARPPGPS